MEMAAPSARQASGRDFDPGPQSLEVEGGPTTRQQQPAATSHLNGGAAGQPYAPAGSSASTLRGAQHAPSGQPLRRRRRRGKQADAFVEPDKVLAWRQNEHAHAPPTPTASAAHGVSARPPRYLALLMPMLGPVVSRALASCNVCRCRRLRATRAFTRRGGRRLSSTLWRCAPSAFRCSCASGRPACTSGSPWCPATSSARRLSASR